MPQIKLQRDTKTPPVKVTLVWRLPQLRGCPWKIDLSVQRTLSGSQVCGPEIRHWHWMGRPGHDPLNTNTAPILPSCTIPNLKAACKGQEQLWYINIFLSALSRGRSLDFIDAAGPGQFVAMSHQGLRLIYHFCGTRILMLLKTILPRTQQLPWAVQPSCKYLPGCSSSYGDQKGWINLNHLRNWFISWNTDSTSTWWSCSITRAAHLLCGCISGSW